MWGEYPLIISFLQPPYANLSKMIKLMEHIWENPENPLARIQFFINALIGGEWFN